MGSWDRCLGWAGERGSHHQAACPSRQFLCRSHLWAGVSFLQTGFFLPPSSLPKPLAISLNSPLSWYCQGSVLLDACLSYSVVLALMLDSPPQMQEFKTILNRPSPARLGRGVLQLKTELAFSSFVQVLSSWKP